MAMQLNIDEDQPLIEINTTPLIDVMLVLLVMLIITIPLHLHALHLQLPVNTATLPQQTEAQQIAPKLLLTIAANGDILWNNVPVADRHQLAEKLQQQARQQPQTIVQLKAHPDSQYQHFAQLLTLVRQQGLNNLSMLAEQP